MSKCNLKTLKGCEKSTVCIDLKLDEDFFLVNI